MRLRRLGPDFDEFVAEYSGRLLRTAFLLCGDRGHAEDLLQTALLRTARRWQVARDNPTAYTRQVLVRLAKDRRRAAHRRVTESALTESDVAGADCVSERVVVRDVLLRATAELPPRQRAVLVLRFFDDLSVEQTAEVLGCTPGTVKSQTHRALAKLREHLAESEIHDKEKSHVE